MTGKSLFLYYALARRMIGSHPTIYQNGLGDVYYFFEGTVYRIPLETTRQALEGRIPESTWALVDSPADPTDKPAKFLRDNDSRLYVVQVTSPEPRRWESVWPKDKDMTPYFLRPFSWKELIRWCVHVPTCRLKRCDRAFFTFSDSRSSQPPKKRPTRQQLLSFFTHFWPIGSSCLQKCEGPGAVHGGFTFEDRVISFERNPKGVGKLRVRPDRWVAHDLARHAG